MLSQLKQTNKGFTFLEVIIAIFVMSIGIVGAVIAIQYAISSTIQSYSRLTAAYLAQEGIEIVRNIRDTNWLEQRIATTTPWDEGLGVGDWEADYQDTAVEDPSLDICVSPCGYDNLSFLKKFNGQLYNYTTGEVTQFKRRITIEKPETNILKVTVTVYWGEGEHSLTTQEYLYNWRSGQ